MSDSKLKAKLNASVASWAKEKAGTQKSTDKRNALARQYHLDFVDVVADDNDYSPFTFVCTWMTAQATKEEPFEAPKEASLSEKKFSSLRARRDEMTAVKDATIKAGADEVKKLWPETTEGVRATSREAFYDRCRAVRDAPEGDNRDASRLIEDSIESRKKAAEKKKRERAAALLGADVSGGINVATLTGVQLADAIALLARRAFDVGSPIATDLMALAQRQRGEIAPSNTNGQPENKAA